MSDYINIPSFYQDLITDVYSENLKKLFEADDILEYLRQVYKQDISLFYDIRDELIMRGLVFKKEYQNNLFPDIPFESQHILFKEKDDQSFKSIDQKVSGLGPLIYRFNITSDLFFLNMPLEGLAYILRKDDIAFLKMLFEKAGFKVELAESYKARPVIRTAQKVKEEKKEYNLHDYLISDWFTDNKFRFFRGYCQKNNIIKMSELSIDIIDGFKLMDGVGSGKYQDALSRYKEFSATIKNSQETILQNNINQFLQNPFRRLLDKIGMDYLKFLDEFYGVQSEKNVYFELPSESFYVKKDVIKEHIIKYTEKIRMEKNKAIVDEFNSNEHFYLIAGLKWVNIYQFLSLEPSLVEDHDVHLYDMLEDTDFYYPVLEAILNNLNKVKKPNEIFEDIDSKLSDREKDIVSFRNDEYTLQEVGELIGVTRERVRQLELKAISKMRKHVQPLQLDIYFQYYAGSEISISVEEFMKLLEIPLEYRYLFIRIIELDPGFTSNGELLMSARLHEHIESKLALIEMKDEKILFVSEVINLVNDNSPFDITLSTMDIFMKKIRYKRNYTIYFKETIKINERISFLFQHAVKGPLELREEGISKLESLSKQYFGMSFEGTHRSVVARTYDAKNVIQVNPFTFMHYKLDEVNPNLIEKIGVLIEEYLKTTDSITAKVIYNDHPAIAQEYNIISHYQLYSIIHYYFSDTYVIGKGNTLGIFKDLSAKVDSATSLVNYLREKGRVVSKEEALTDLKWEQYKLDQLVDRIDEVIFVEGSQLKLIDSFNFSETEIQSIKDFVIGFVKADYVFTQDLLIEMEFDDELSRILGKYGLSDTYTLASVLKWIDPDLRGFQNLLYKKDGKVDSIEKAIAAEFPTVIKRNEIDNFLKEKGYAGSTLFKVMNELLERKYFYFYTTYSFINSSAISFTGEVKESLKNYLNSLFVNKKYISVIDMVGYTRDLLPINNSLNWTPHLIYEFAPEVGYIQINTTSDYRYNKWVLVPEHLGIRNYEELVHYVLLNDYDGIMQEKEIAAFLQSKKLNHNPQSLSYELKTSEFFEFKELGFVELREVPYGSD